MKRFLLLLTLGTLLFYGSFSCDKVSSAYPPSDDLDTTIYPGNSWLEYVTTEWPTFSANTNTNRNVLIEDFTGHECVFCPAAGALAEDLEHNNPGRVFTTAIHAGPSGLGSFQELHPPVYIYDFTNPEGLDIGKFFGSIPGTAFTGNPHGAISRYPVNGKNTLSPAAWENQVNSLLSTNNLAVNIQAKVKYYSETNGFYLHTEIENVAAITNDLAQVVYFVEDSLVKPQAFPSGIDSLNYVHHNLHRGCIDGNAFGRTLADKYKQSNGKYYLNYSYKIPAMYNPDNVHLLIYVYDKVTYEVYQVIKVDVK